MKPTNGYFDTNGKISKITEDGMRINVYPSGIVTTQLPGESHSVYKTNMEKKFMDMTPNQMSDYSFSFFNFRFREFFE